MNGSVKTVLIGGYIAIGILFALYRHFFGHDLHGFAYHLGQGLVWPAVMFPSVGKAIGAVILLIVVGSLILAG